MKMANPSAPPEIRGLREAEGPAAVEILQSGFRDDPTLAWCFLRDAPGYEERLAGYLRTGHAWHVATGFPVYAATAPGTDGALLGVAYVGTPDVDASEESVRELERQLVAACGEEAAARFARYNAAVDEVAPDVSAHSVALIAVREDVRGTGVGTALMRAVIDNAVNSPTSEGLWLDTGNPRNLPFYARLGFDECAKVEIESLSEWVLFRPNP